MRHKITKVFKIAISILAVMLLVVAIVMIYLNVFAYKYRFKIRGFLDMATLFSAGYIILVPLRLKRIKSNVIKAIKARRIKHRALWMTMIISVGLLNMPFYWFGAGTTNIGGFFEKPAYEELFYAYVSSDPVTIAEYEKNRTRYLSDVTVRRETYGGFRHWFVEDKNIIRNPFMVSGYRYSLVRTKGQVFERGETTTDRYYYYIYNELRIGKRSKVISANGETYYIYLINELY